MNNAPYWNEIWDDQSWQMFEPRAQRSRTYYKVRSVLRFALWIPLVLIAIEVGLAVL